MYASFDEICQLHVHVAKRMAEVNPLIMEQQHLHPLQCLSTNTGLLIILTINVKKNCKAI